MKEVTLADEMEDLLLKDLMDSGCEGKELEVKLLVRKHILNRAFNELIQERLQEETVSPEDAMRKTDY